MVRKGINKEVIVREAVKLMEEKGYDHFSMHELAARLSIKTASLYNHIKNMEDLYNEIGYYAIDLFKDIQINAIKDKHQDEALYALGYAYRQFVKDHSELYKVIMSLPMKKGSQLWEHGAHIIDPILQVLDDYHLNEDDKHHFQRIWRSSIHGFVSQEENGFFSHYQLDIEKSYQMTIACYINGLKEMINNR